MRLYLALIIALALLIPWVRPASLGGRLLLALLVFHVLLAARQAWRRVDP